MGGQLLLCKAGPHLAKWRPPAGEGAGRRGPVGGSRAWAGQHAAGHRGPGATKASVYDLESSQSTNAATERPDMRREVNSAGVQELGLVARRPQRVPAAYRCFVNIFVHSSLSRRYGRAL